MYLEIIDNEQFELYQLGIELSIIKLVNWLSIIMLGILFDRLIDSVVFAISFLFLRKYAGGYHAKTSLKCLILTNITVALSLLLIKYYNIGGIVNICAGIFLLLIDLYIGPIQSPNKPIDKLEINNFKKKFAVVSVIEIMVIVILEICDYSYITESIIISWVVFSFSLVMGYANYKKC